MVSTKKAGKTMRDWIQGRIQHGIMVILAIFFLAGVLQPHLIEGQATPIVELSWRRMSDAFRQELTALQITLQTALSDAETSKSNLQSLTNSYKELLTKTESLETSLTVTGEKLAETERELATERGRAWNLTLILAGIVLFLLVTRVAGAILWARGIKLPYLLNLIL